MANVTVYPTKASVLRIVHPSHGPLKAGGVGTSWIMDGFTSRMLTDGLVTMDVSKAYAGQANPLAARNTLATPPLRPAATKRKA
jgi:hypothetical protein